jgi:hypothetical protein
MLNAVGPLGTGFWFLLFVFTSDYDIHAFAGCSLAFARYTKDLLHQLIKNY